MFVELGDFVLVSEKYKYVIWWQFLMIFVDFVKGVFDIVVFCFFGEVDGDFVLMVFYVDNLWWSFEECGILCKFFNM